MCFSPSAYFFTIIPDFFTNKTDRTFVKYSFIQYHLSLFTKKRIFLLFPAETVDLLNKYSDIFSKKISYAQVKDV